jgi:hypothetical protein
MTIDAVDTVLSAVRVIRDVVQHVLLSEYSNHVLNNSRLGAVVC